MRDGARALCRKNTNSWRLSRGSPPPPPLSTTSSISARLVILSILEEAEEADSTYLRKALGLTDGNLGRHPRVQVGARYVQLHESCNGRPTKTGANITPRGRQAFLAEITALKPLVVDVKRRSRLQSDEEVVRRQTAPSPPARPALGHR